MSFAGLVVGSILPDVDMLWWVVASSKANHHMFFTHRPLTWLGVAAASSILLIPYVRSRRWGALGLGLAIGGLLHCVLDSPVGGIQWLHPWSESLYYGSQVIVPTVKIPSLPGWLDGRVDRWMWVRHFIHHWTFAVETWVTGLALGVWVGSRRK